MTMMAVLSFHCDENHFTLLCSLMHGYPLLPLDRHAHPIFSMRFRFYDSIIALYAFHDRTRLSVFVTFLSIAEFHSIPLVLLACWVVGVGIV
jgi:hypothetical protein